MDKRASGMSLCTELHMQMIVVVRHNEMIPNVPRQDGSGTQAAFPGTAVGNAKHVLFILS